MANHGKTAHLRNLLRALALALPVVLGDRLPADVIAALVRRIRRCVTPHGLATEDPAERDKRRRRLIEVAVDGKRVDVYERPVMVVADPDEHGGP